MLETESIVIAEQAVIGSILLDDRVFSGVEIILAPEHFVSQELAIIFGAFKELRREGVEITVVSTTEYLGRKGNLDKIGGPVKLMHLCDNIGSSSQAEYYAQKVLEASIARQYAKTCKLIHTEAKQAAEGKTKISEVIAKHLKELDKISHFATDSSDKIDWMSAKSKNFYKIVWPLKIHEYVNMFPKNIAVVGGASNAGKTALLLNVAYENRLIQQVKYFSSEMGPDELKERIELFGYPLNDWELIDFRDRSSSFSSVIDPDALNIIDYLEINDNFYQIGEQIKQIYDRLKKGVAIIAIQKKSGTDYARGGEFTLEKARLYISLDFKRAKIVKGKHWAQRGVSPKGLVFPFKMQFGSQFELESVPYKEE